VVLMAGSRCAWYYSDQGPEGSGFVLRQTRVVIERGATASE
jgi:hypothetical protein